jgi:translation elongation factor EF-G
VSVFACACATRPLPDGRPPQKESPGSTAVVHSNKREEITEASSGDILDLAGLNVSTAGGSLPS